MATGSTGVGVVIMDALAAEQQLRQYIAERVALHRYSAPPEGLYMACADREHYFGVSGPCELGIGATRIFAVNKDTGAVRDVGCVGE